MCGENASGRLSPELGASHTALAVPASDIGQGIWSSSMNTHLAAPAYLALLGAELLEEM